MGVCVSVCVCMHGCLCECVRVYGCVCMYGWGLELCILKDLLRCPIVELENT